MKIQSIEIEFPVEVELPEGFQQELDKLLDTVCKLYEKQNPTKIMWPFGQGSKPIWREPQEPDFDGSIYFVEIAERKGMPKELERRKKND